MRARRGEGWTYEGVGVSLRSGGDGGAPDPDEGVELGEIQLWLLLLLLLEPVALQSASIVRTLVRHARVLVLLRWVSVLLLLLRLLLLLLERLLLLLQAVRRRRLRLLRLLPVEARLLRIHLGCGRDGVPRARVVRLLELLLLLLSVEPGGLSPGAAERTPVAPTTTCAAAIPAPIVPDALLRLLLLLLSDLLPVPKSTAAATRCPARRLVEGVDVWVTRAAG